MERNEWKERSVRLEKSRWEGKESIGGRQDGLGSSEIKGGQRGCFSYLAVDILTRWVVSGRYRRGGGKEDGEVRPEGKAKVELLAKAG